MHILTSFLTQLLFCFGIIVLFGLLLHLFRVFFLHITGEAGFKGLFIVGFIGIPIHEISHATFCLIFGHKIDDMVLFDPERTSGSFGYVEHSFNPSNIYHQIGNFFIGIAPLVFGSLLIVLMMFLCLRDTFNNLTLEYVELFEDARVYGTLYVIKHAFKSAWKVIVSVLHYSNLKNWKWWIFIIISFMIAAHMELSLQDILSTLVGAAILIGIFLVMDVVIGLISKEALLSVTGFLVSISSVFLGIMGVAVAVRLIEVIIALVVLLIEFISYQFA